MRKYIYLSGPILGCTDEECKNWRRHAKLNLTSPAIDPMIRDYRGRQQDFVKEIVEQDKRDIDMCTHLLVNYDKPSVGTSMEILYAWENKKIVIVVIPKDITVSPWLTYHSHKIFNSLNEAIDFLNEEE